MLREQFDSGQGIEECVLVLPSARLDRFLPIPYRLRNACACERPLRADCVEEVGE
jgi:hypothetical protein